MNEFVEACIARSVLSSTTRVQDVLKYTFKSSIQFIRPNGLASSPARLIASDMVQQNETHTLILFCSFRFDRISRRRNA